jgi:hypothetical protein
MECRETDYFLTHNFCRTIQFVSKQHFIVMLFVIMIHLHISKVKFKYI